MGFMFCDLHVSLKLPFVRGYKFVEFALLFTIDMLKSLNKNFNIKIQNNHS